MTDSTLIPQIPGKVEKGPRYKHGPSSNDALATALRGSDRTTFNRRSQNVSILLPFLAALGWRGSERDLFEALPHFADDFDAIELRNILSTLGYPTRERAITKLSDMDDRLIPCIACHKDGDLFLVLSDDKFGYVVLDSSTGDAEVIEDLEGLTCAFVPERNTRAADQAWAKRTKSDSWVFNLIMRFHQTIWKMLGVSLVVNMMALVAPLFVLLLYDQVIPLRSEDVWFGLTVGVLIGFGFDLFLRFRRARMIAYIGARLDFAIASSTFAKLLSLPAHMTEGAPIGDQVSKLRDFDGLRDVFTGLLVTVLLDLPFLIISLALLAVIAGSLAFIPLVMMLLYLMIWLAIAPALKRSVAASSKAKAERHSFLVETLSFFRTLKEAAVEDIWLERYRDFSANAAMTQHRTAQLAFLMQTLSQGIMMLSGLVTLAVGVHMAIAGHISLGVLIASMAIIWRVLTPLQNLFLSITRIEQVKVAVRQIDTLMKLRSEQSNKQQTAGLTRTWQGTIRFNRVSLKYGKATEPALLGVTFSIKSQEFLAITGSNGSGKSSLFRLLLGLQRAQAGQIFLDGLDIRQIPPAELRTSIAYVPQNTKMFHGTIAQNIRLGNPAASDHAIKKACKLSGILDDIEKLDRGFDTRIGDQTVWQVNAGFMQKLALARAYVMDAPILLLDEPAHALDEQGDQSLMSALKAFKYKKTIIMVSHRPSHIRLADRVLVLDGGTIIADGTPDDIYNRGENVL